MDNLLENWKSSQELLEIRYQRRLRLIQAVSIIGSSILFVFAVMSLQRELSYLTFMLFFCAFTGFINLRFLFRSDGLKISLTLVNSILYALVLFLFVTGGIEGTGILWAYPIVAILLFINQFRFACILVGSLIALCCFVILTPLSEFIYPGYSELTTLRFLFTIISLYIMCLVKLYWEDNTYDMISQRHDEDIHKLAFSDPLTGLSNRWTLNHNLHRLLEQQAEDKLIAVLFIDLDNFKHVNDNYGHEVGDQLLNHFAKQLRVIVRPSDIVTKKSLSLNNDNDAVRLAGDEFVVVLNDIEELSDIESIAYRIVNLFEGGYEMSGDIYPVFVSIGISISPDDTDKAQDLLRYSDAAMYEAKAKGNNLVKFFSGVIAEKLKRRSLIEISLKESLDGDHFSLVYLPIFSCATKDIVGLEALIRCHHPDLVDIGPDKYIPIAESIGLIRKIDLWVIENSIKDLKVITASSDFNGYLHINISGIELQDEDFPDRVCDIVDAATIKRNKIVLEITETALVTDNPTMISVLKKLKARGFSLSLDDFGTGYTSFNQLIMYPADSLKVDKTFTDRIFSSDNRDKKLMQIIHKLGESYNLSVIAEGVETQEQLDFLIENSFEYVQGFLLSPPLEQKALTEFIIEKENNSHNAAKRIPIETISQ